MHHVFKITKKSTEQDFIDFDCSILSFKSKLRILTCQIYCTKVFSDLVRHHVHDLHKNNNKQSKRQIHHPSIIHQIRTLSIFFSFINLYVKTCLLSKGHPKEPRMTTARIPFTLLWYCTISWYCTFFGTARLLISLLQRVNDEILANKLSFSHDKSLAIRSFDPAVSAQHRDNPAVNPPADFISYWRLNENTVFIQKGIDRTHASLQRASEDYW